MNKLTTALEGERELFKQECKKGFGKWATAATHIELKPFLNASNLRILSAVEEMVEENPLVTVDDKEIIISFLQEAITNTKQ